MATKEKVEKWVKKEEALSYLKDIVTQVEAGYVMVGERKIALPSEFEFEIKYKYDENDKKKHEITIEFEWKEG
ncbi:MAG: amphi-Trp domain-containing protein [Caldimicrobium sp.]